jgi:class 3 adenylate cyclase/formylglycine-generating enzyme required for sulfatase activity
MASTRADPTAQRTVSAEHRFAAVMFTDIVDSTAYYSASGDLAGRLRVRQHDDTLYPVVADHRGAVLNHTGDGLLAVFDEPDDCCAAAIEMQRTLQRANATVPPDDQLHIRIAAHAGVALREADNVFGGIVNTAARIESLALGDQIVVSESIYAHLGDGLRQRCRFLQERELRGTGRVHRLYELEWSTRPVGPPARRTAPAVTAPVPGAVAAGPQLTALCTDVEASTRLFEQFGPSAEEALAVAEQAVVEAVDRHHGRLVRVAGDTVHAVFRDAPLACAAAVEIQRAMADQDWGAVCPGLDRLGLRVSLHAADVPDAIDEAVERAARLGSAGHGGQILLTRETYEQVQGRLPPGTVIRDHGTRLLQDHRTAEAIVELARSDQAPGTTPLRTPPAPVTVPTIRIDPSVDRRHPDALVTDLLQALRVEDGMAVLSTDEATELATAKPADLATYRLGRVLEWSQPRYRLDTRFVQLSLLVDRGEDAADERWRVSEQAVEDVGDLLRAVKEPAFVVLGPPGAGKTTILRRLELEAALAGIRDDAVAQVPFLVALSQFVPAAGETTRPEEWLAGQWAGRFPGLPSLSELADDGRMLFLLDGLNEMPSADDREYRRSVRLWKGFVERTVARSPRNRFVFSCRSLDYSAPLSSPTLRVPQVRIEPMSDTQVRQFLKLYAPSRWAELWDEIGGSRQLDLHRSPFFLQLLLSQVADQGAIPKGRAGLFTGFVRQALRRELERDNRLFEDEELVSGRDRRRLVAWAWKDPHSLPDRGALIPLLEQLAYRMQEHGQGGEGAQVRVDIDDAIDLMDHPAAEAVVSAGVALSILDERTADDELHFTHQLLQEYFAARRLAREVDPGCLTVPWRARETVPDLAATLSSLAPADPLPPLPGTGWEETAVLAAAMADEPSAFVRAVAEANLALAGRCAAQPDVEERLEPGLFAELRRRLAHRSRDPEADLRDRIQGGLVLGELGGPEFDRATGPYGVYLRPAMIEIPGGDYVIGSDEPYEYAGQLHREEQPTTTLRLEPFAIGRFAVTNAEWRCFMDGGGYDDESLWEGDEARAWLRGEGTVVNIRNMARYWRRRFTDEPELIERELERDHMERSMYELWHRRLRMTDEQFERHMVDYYPAGPLREPRFWRDHRYNNPMQPVIGISCFEARAYARWLSVQSGLAYHLPSEAQWEAAARGLERREFAYGDDFDPLRGNTVETHVRAPTPVGVFPDGDTDLGVADLTGNTYDLTASLWGEDALETSWPYPYRPDDGREAFDVPVTVSRVGRGGAWYLGRVHARAAYRGRDRYDLRPDEWLNFRGCRVARSGPAGS